MGSEISLHWECHMARPYWDAEFIHMSVVFSHVYKIKSYSVPVDNVTLCCFPVTLIV